MDLDHVCFQQAFEHSAIGMALVTPDGRFVRVNPSWCAILGRSQEEMWATTVQAVTHPDDRAASHEAMRRLLAGLGLCLRLEKRFLHKNGTTIWAEMTGSLIRDAQGRPSFFVAQIQDISERRRLAEQYRQAQRMEAIGQLAGGVAHDFNNLLTIIGGYTELMLSGTSPDSWRAFLKEIQKASQRAAGLTRQLLAFSRRQVLTPVSLSLPEVVAEMVGMIRRFLRENIEVVSSLEPALWRVRADPAQMEQVLLNLAINAGDAMPGGGTLTLTTANVVLDETYTRGQREVAPGRYVRISVTDTGCGMDESTRARLFEPFFTTKEIGKGTGLGLATVYGILKQSGGHIDFASEVGRGTTFNIYLPACETGLSDPGATAPDPLTSPSRETILLVEDDAGVRFLVRDVLAKTGYTILEARNGPEAIRLCQDFGGAIDLVLSDVVMPEMSGPELREHLGQLRPQLRFLYMSAYTDDVLVLEGVAGNETAFLQKPFSTQLLARKVREVLDR
jgi:PAS domain S-box-containing protein